MYTQYSVTVTPQTSGLYYTLFAFREVPAFFRFDDASVTVSGSQVNLLTNPGFEGSTTPSSVNSDYLIPNGWGVVYQNGADPGAGGTVSTDNTPHSGSAVWYDGSVNSFDGIYQTTPVIAGQSYLISFFLSADDPFQTGIVTPTGGEETGIEMAVYFGACDALDATCSTALGSGFTVQQPPTANPTINTTGGDIAPNIFSLGSSAANASTVVFDGGTLRMIGGSFPDNIIGAPVTIDANNGTVDTGPASGGFSGVVSGPGSLTVIGSNTFSLTNANTYAGGTFLDGGILAVGNNAALGTGALTFGGGMLQAAVDGLTIGNAATLASTGTIDTQGFSLTYAGVIGGSGQLAKIGSGTLTLTTANTFTGGVALNAGTLAVGDNAALGTGMLTFGGGTLRSAVDGLVIDNAATLAGNGTIDTQGFGLIYMGSIGGAGSLSKIGSGTLALVAANSFSGGLTLDAGTVAVANGAALGTGTLTFAGGTLQSAVDGLSIANAATLASNGTIDTQGFGLTYAGTIGGSGQLTKIGSGTLTLPGANTYTGGTMLAGGVLTIGDSAALGTGTLGFAGGMLRAGADGLAVANAATLSANGTIDTQAFGFTYGGVIAGTGQLTKIGSGTLALTAGNSYAGGTSVLAGTLAIGDSAALGTGPLALADGTTLRFIAPNLDLANAVTLGGTLDPTIDTGASNETISGPISGPGALTKLGTGMLELTGTNTYTGDTTVAQGVLLVDGSTAASAVTVDSGAVIGGGGTIGALTLTNGSALALAATKTLSVVGNVTFSSGSTYQVTINADGTGGKLAVGGKATLGGAALSVVAGSGTFGASTYTLLSAVDGVSGTFGTVTTDNSLALLSPSVGYAANAVTLTLNPVAFASIAATPNQAAVAAAIQALGPASPLYQAVLSQSKAGAQQAFDAASGVSHADPAAIVSSATRLMTSLIVDRLWDVGGNGLSAREMLDQFAPDQLPALVRCYGPVPDPVPAAPQRAYTAWGEAFGSFGHSDATANAGGLDRSLGGFILGIDTPIDHVLGTSWRTGVAAGYTSTAFHSSLDAADGTVQGVYGSLYSGARYGAVDVRVGATVGGTFTDSRRTVAFPGFLESEHGFDRGITVQGFGEVGYRFTNASTVLEPVAGASILHLHQDGFNENGGAAALSVAGQDTDLGVTSLGVRGEAVPIRDVPLTAHGYLAWQHTIGNVMPATIMAFEANPAQTFSVTGAPIDRDALAAEAALDYRATAALVVGLSYNGLVGPTASDHSVKGRFEYRF